MKNIVLHIFPCHNTWNPHRNTHLFIYQVIRAHKIIASPMSNTREYISALVVMFNHNNRIIFLSFSISGLSVMWVIQYI